MLPGINDAHIHAALYGGTRPPLVADVSYPTVKSIRDILKAIAKRVKTAKPGEWIQGIGWDDGYLEECLKDHRRYPSRWDLDMVSPDNPVVLGHYTQHEVWVNSRALEMAGITESTSSPDGGVIVKDPATGEPTGILREFPAQALIMKRVPLWTKAEKRQGILAMIRDLNTRGITSITEGALGSGGNEFQGGLLGTECLDIYHDLLDENELTLRVSWLYLFGEYGSCTYEDFRQVIPELGIHSGFGNEWLRLAGVKIFADGTPMGQTAWMYDEYPDGGGRGSLVVPGRSDKERCREMVRMIRFAHNHGFQVGVHAVGGRAIEAAIDGFIKAEKGRPKQLRHYVLHSDFISDEYIQLAARHHFGVGVQPILKWKFSDQMDKLLGIELSARQFPVRNMIDAGVHVIGGSDAPVVEPDWLAGIQAAVLRESKATGTLRGPENRITVPEAIRMFTIEGAWQDHMERQKGSIEVGKLADMCVLDEDILSVEPHSIKDIKNVMTVAGGRVVYCSENF
ncbi:MAG: amidohydrolase [Dehalococcoidales bacterium]|nr:amidohydrolase [Dehalococcoidales bacterium]